MELLQLGPRVLQHVFLCSVLGRAAAAAAAVVVAVLVNWLCFAEQCGSIVTAPLCLFL